MKFLYIDESGGEETGDIFVMCGLMVDAYRLRKKTAECEELLSIILQSHPGDNLEFKTSKYMGDKGHWKNFPIDQRRQSLRKICKLACGLGNQIYGFALSKSKLASAFNQISPPIKKHSYWHVSAMFIASLVQKKMQKKDKNKGHTVLVVDDN